MDFGPVPHDGAIRYGWKITWREAPLAPVTTEGGMP